MKTIITFLIAIQAIAGFHTDRGTVLEQSYEGGEQYNDYYIIEYENGQIHEIEADDLEPGDHVITIFSGEIPMGTRYTK